MRPGDGPGVRAACQPAPTLGQYLISVNQGSKGGIPGGRPSCEERASPAPLAGLQGHPDAAEGLPSVGGGGEVRPSASAGRAALPGRPHARPRKP